MLKKEGLLSKIIGIALLTAIVIVVVLLANKKDANEIEADPIYGAIGGGKEELLRDEKINEIFAKKYNFRLVQDSWSNGKTIVQDVRRDNGDMYDLIFFSDERFYNEYQTEADPRLGEAQRYRQVAGKITLNTPIVMYSWADVVDKLIEDGIVTIEDGVYYITDMDKLMRHILNGDTWKSINVNKMGSINIDSVDPVTSSPGASYYGLLLRILTNSSKEDKDIKAALPKLKAFYNKSGFMNNAPADLFSNFLATRARPLIVDYEKSIIEFANKDPDGWAAIKDDIRILYPRPTIWNSHCISALTENGKKLIEGFEDKEVSQIAWSKYGFRVGILGGNYDVTKIGDGSDKTKVTGIPAKIEYAAEALNIQYYNDLINYLKESK